jgi:asparagine synthase (glutamine-hydrolysing)
MQRPSIDGLNTYLVSKAVHEAGFKVALSGLGGDEAVGGYSHFRLLRYMPALQVLHRMPGLVTDMVAKILVARGVASEGKATKLLGKDGPRNGSELSLLHREVLPASLVDDLTGIYRRPIFDGSSLGDIGALGPFGTMVAAEVAFYLETTLLPDADGFSMASSVELRVPFVDSLVFSASLQLAARKRIPPGKTAIGMALDDPYLRGLAAHPKRGFSVPMRHWMTGPLVPVLNAADDPQAAVWSILDRAVAEHAGLLPLRARDRWTETWTLVALNAWLETLSVGLVNK